MDGDPGPLDAFGRVVQLPEAGRSGRQRRRYFFDLQPAPHGAAHPRPVDDGRVHLRRERRLPTAPTTISPIAWCHRYDGGRAWYSGLAGAQASFSDATMLRPHQRGHRDHRGRPRPPRPAARRRRRTRTRPQRRPHPVRRRHRRRIGRLHRDRERPRRRHAHVLVGLRRRRHLQRPEPLAHLRRGRHLRGDGHGVRQQGRDRDGHLHGDRHHRQPRSVGDGGAHPGRQHHDRHRDRVHRDRHRP